MERVMREKKGERCRCGGEERRRRGREEDMRGSPVAGV